jgi:TPP-dependent pyruvate/acetoin dehydrogenase alpha subunit
MNINQKVSLFSMMLRIRLIEEAIAAEYPKGEMRCPIHLSVGQELLPSLVGLLSKNDDLAVSSHRSHAHYLAKGGSLKKLIAELYGKETGCSRGRGGSMHLIDLDVNFMCSTAIVGNSIPVGVGMGYGAKLKNKNAVVLIYLGDGAIEEGSFYESINFALVRNIPALFLCENNNYSVYSHISDRQPGKRRIHEMAYGLGITSKLLTSANIENSYSELNLVLKNIRETMAPAFIEIDAFRFLEHCGPSEDDHLEYRDKNYLREAINNDPLRLLDAELNTLIENWNTTVSKMKIEFESEINEAFQFARNSRFPNLETENLSPFALVK